MSDEAISAMLTCKNITKAFTTHGRSVKAVDDVSFSITRGETFGLVGESGSGKTTIGRIVLGILKPDSGTVELAARKVQAVFQDPYTSLDPKMVVRDILAEGLVVQKSDLTSRLRSARSDFDARIKSTLDLIALSQGALTKYPHQFSGGERQRIAIGRAIITDPDFIVCDEPVSSLDVTIQLQILNLLKEIRRRLNITLLFVSHDLKVIRFMCDRVAVMKEGKLVEEGLAKAIYDSPQEPYTKKLLNSVLEIVKT